jgi:pimeloyl-ACP methyl ester carboxylesterase
MRLDKTRSWRCVRPVAAGILVAGLLLAARVEAIEVLLKDGRILRGRKGETTGLAELSAGGESDTLKQIVFVNDDFRITFVSRRQVQGLQPDTSLDNAEKFNCEQPRWDIGKNNRKKVISVGPPAGELKPFDEWGRRSYPMRTAGGVEKVVQVITEITPQYARVEALKYTWDMRVATSTLDDDTLEKLLMHQISPKNVAHRKKIVSFFLQCKRYGKAVEVLQKLLNDGIADTKDQQELLQTKKLLRIMYAQQMLDELGLRRTNGQHALVQRYLDKFPTDDVPGEILQTIRQVKQEYAEIEKQRLVIRGELDKLLLLVPGRPERAELAAALRVIDDELNAETMPRMAAYLQNRNVPGIKPEELLSLAVGGWLLGANVATPDLPLTLSAWRMHRYVRDYLAEPMKVKRTRILPNILTQAAARPEIVAALAARMRPPYALPELVDEATAGFYKVEVDVAADQPSATYYVQLPPEYDPLRRYPMIVSLHGVGMDPELEIDWWAGDKPARHGQAGRNGYIVIAPEWTVEHQKEYEGSPREHAVVLGSTRDACRRFAVDTDRVFLAGHSTGGDAAWDIGVSHPDLWAGVIPISAEALYSCKFYTDNARYVPFYVVLGQLDGGRITRDALVLDRYLKLGFNTTVVEYLGRGHEHFVDEMLPLLDWMGRCKRSFPLPRDREFICQTMRPTDNRFWWAEVAELPPAAAVAIWPAPKGTKPLAVRGSVPVNNNVSLTAGNLGATIWLSPELVDFKARVNITLGGRRPAGVPPMIKPSVETMLEDLRVRGDRQHPFWAKVEAK